MLKVKKKGTKAIYPVSTNKAPRQRSNFVVLVSLLLTLNIFYKLL